MAATVSFEANKEKASSAFCGSDNVGVGCASFPFFVFLTLAEQLIANHEIIE
jgi:hypothetical protein